MKLQHRLFAMIVIFSLPVTANAIPVSYDFTLTTTTGLSVVGDFTANNDTPDDGWIRTAELIELNYVLNDGSTLVGTVTGLNATTSSRSDQRFNFNYNLLTGTFAQAGDGYGPDGNAWGWYHNPNAPIIIQNNNLTYHSNITHLSHGGTIAVNGRQASAVPSPSPIALLGAGLLALGCTRKKLRQNVTPHS